LCSLNEDAPVSGHRPSVDVLFRSGARVVGPGSIGVILTGMGKDGAQGMLEMREAGALTLGQDQDSSLIYGMPRVAFELGGVMRQFPLGDMADAIIDACNGGNVLMKRGVSHPAHLVRAGGWQRDGEGAAGHASHSTGPRQGRTDQSPGGP